MLDYFSNKVLTPDFLCLAGYQLLSHIALHGCDLSGVYTPLLFLTHTHQYDLLPMEAHRGAFGFAFIEVASYPHILLFLSFGG